MRFAQIKSLINLMTAMYRIALLRSPTDATQSVQSCDAGYIQVWLPIDFLFGRRGTVTGEELGFVTDRRIYGGAAEGTFDAKRRYKFVQWMPLSMI